MLLKTLFKALYPASHALWLVGGGDTGQLSLQFEL